MTAEFDFIEQVLRPHATSEAALDLRDDAALLGQGRVVASDALVAGVHFLASDPPETLMPKALGVNISDMLAMGAKPEAFLLTLLRPANLDATWETGFAKGLSAGLERYGVDLLGGDTVQTPGPLALSLTLIGNLEGRAPWLRSGAKPGQRLAVLGQVGAGWCGLQTAKGAIDFGETALGHYRQPIPPVEGAQNLAKARLVQAAIDISDGLIQDAGHMALASGVRLELDAEALPLFEPEQFLEEQVSGGDDYSLLLALKPSDLEAARFMVPGLRPMGRVLEGEGVALLDASGKAIQVKHGGYIHA